MELRLFEIKCEECEFEMLATSNEYMCCPNCGEETLKWSNDTILATTSDIFKSEIDGLIEDENDVLAAIVVANSYISGDSTIARFEDIGGFSLNFKETEFTKEIAKILKLNSTDELENKIYEDMYDIHPSLIYDPVFECIERDSYSDEDGNLFESGRVMPSTAKKFYDWIQENKDYVVKILIGQNVEYCEDELNYEYVKDVFYKGDFYDWSKDDNIDRFNDEDGEFSESEKQNFFYELNFVDGDKEYKLSPIKYLHGRCDEFAIALAKKMGYRVGIAYEVDEATGRFTQLIHAYCVKDDCVDIQEIDVRGVCPDYTQIVAEPEFEYSYDYTVYDIMDVEEAIGFFEDNMRDCRNGGHYHTPDKEITTIIDMFVDKFKI